MSTFPTRQKYIFEVEVTRKERTEISTHQPLVLQGLLRGETVTARGQNVYNTHTQYIVLTVDMSTARRHLPFTIATRHFRV